MDQKDYLYTLHDVMDNSVQADDVGPISVNV